MVSLGQSSDAQVGKQEGSGLEEKKWSRLEDSGLRGVQEGKQEGGNRSTRLEAVVLCNS